jgi:hypothetical protein
MPAARASPAFPKLTWSLCSRHAHALRSCAGTETGGFVLSHQEGTIPPCTMKSAIVVAIVVLVKYVVVLG